MKLYAIRKRKQGGLISIDGNILVSRDPEKLKGLLSVFDDNELITFRIEPTEPCDWCSGEYQLEGSFVLNHDCLRISMDDNGRAFCPNCGRKLEEGE